MGQFQPTAAGLTVGGQIDIRGGRHLKDPLVKSAGRVPKNIAVMGSQIIEQGGFVRLGAIQAIQQLFIVEAPDETAGNERVIKGGLAEIPDQPPFPFGRVIADQSQIGFQVIKNFRPASDLPQNVLERFSHLPVVNSPHKVENIAGWFLVEQHPLDFARHDLPFIGLGLEVIFIR